ncbi:c-type cytochrome [Akkermansiaceae bacterium]|mgnify:FL=1|nr:c-type cytochrome [Akkermansiaceae bacterium]
MKIPLVLSIVLIAVFFAAGAGKEKETTLRVATFDLDVTPPVGSAMAYTMVGKDPELSLRCRGVVILGAGKPIVICAIDWIGVANEGYDQFRDALAKAAGTTRDRVALHALHQHDAPGCDFTAEKLVKKFGLKGYERTKGDFHREVIGRAAAAVRESLPKAQKVTHYGWGEAAVEKVASNRRILGPDGKVRAVRYTTTRDPALRAEPEGTIDPDVSLLSFWSKNEPVAVLSYYACHPQSYYLTGTPSPDFPGIARFMRGQGVPDALHLHFNGAGGNLGAGKYNDGNKENRMILANRMAEGMLKAWNATKKWEVGPDGIRFEVEKVRLPLANHLKDEEKVMEALKNQPGRGYFANVDQAAFMLRHKAGNQIDVSCLSVGDSRVLHMPGELFVEYQLKAKAMRPDLKIAMAAYGEYGTGYIGTEIGYKEGGYETSPSASAVGPGSEKILTAAMKKLLSVKSRKKQGQAGPKSPKEAMAGFETRPGFEMQLVASEPQIHEPIVLSYDENGLMYVAEYLKFPSHHGKSDGPDGCIRLLKDENGDGHYETGGIFAEGLEWPTGICCWDGGVYVVAAPDLWYLKDTNGDGRADHREKIFTGFGFRNDEGTANNLIWGLDHWIYGAGSNSGGEIKSLVQSDAKNVSIRGRDFRFHPKTRKFEAIPGSEQFGNAIDDWGNRFLSQNSKPAVNVVLSSESSERNPFLPVPSAKVDLWKDPTIYRASRIEDWRLARTKLRLAEKRSYPAPSVSHDVFSGCSGLQIYRGAVYPKEFRGNLFVGDVQGNLIHRRSLAPQGMTFTSERTELKSEFLRSKDNWFRPANLVNAPDGTLHVVDMYREIIETPDSMVKKIFEMVDFRSGREFGRIYRLAPKGFEPPPPPRLGEVTLPELVRTLENQNGWWRDTAGRLIVERGGMDALPGLRALLRESDWDVTRLHALYAIAGLGGLEESDLKLALTDVSAGLREHGLRLYRKDYPNLRGRLFELAIDENVRVRFQAALVLGDLGGGEAASALAKMSIRDAANRWIRFAVLSARPENALAVFKNLERKIHRSPLFEPLAFVIGARHEKSEVVALLGILKETASDFPVAAVMSKLGEGLKSSGSTLRDYPKATEVMAKLVERARMTLKNDGVPSEEQVEAVRILGQTDDQVVSDLHELLVPSRTVEVQQAALAEIAEFGVRSSAGKLIDQLPELSPSVRSEATEVLLGRDAWIEILLVSIEKKQIFTHQISQAQQMRLLKHANPTIQKLAKKMFSAKGTPRDKVVQEYKAAHKLSGDAGRGLEVFRKNCAACHRHEKEGYEIGPDIATVKNRDYESALIQILDPNREVLANFEQYFVTLKNGQVVTGRIIRESGSGLTLVRAGGVQSEILRKNIKSITSTGRSLMPEGLEAVIDLQSMSDLWAFLKS